MSRSCLAAILVPVLLFSVGCAPLPTASDLTPPLSGSDYRNSNKSLTVGEVAGKEQKDVTGVVTISVGNDVIRDALVDTLRASGIFRDVSTKPGGDYGLSTQIISQKFDMNTLILLVRYQLIDGASGRNIWAGNILSEKSIGVDEIFSGAERTKKLREIVFRDNFTKLAAQVNGALLAQEQR
jgi:hypothetical protein